MIGPVHGLVAKLPRPVRKDQHEQEEEDPDHLEEDAASHSAEWPEESADASRHIGGSPPGRLAGHAASSLA